MTDPLHRQFRAYVESTSFGDPNLNLSYEGRQLLEAHRYAELAERRLPAVRRAIGFATLSGGIAAVLMGIGFLALVGVAFDVLPRDVTLGEVWFPLFFTFCMGLAGLGSLWRRSYLEDERLICRLVIEVASEKREAESRPERRAQNEAQDPVLKRAQEEVQRTA